MTIAYKHKAQQSIYMTTITTLKNHGISVTATDSKVSAEVLVWLPVWSEVQMICIWSSWCQRHPIISYIIKIQNGSAFLVQAYTGCPGKEAMELVFFATDSK